MDADNRLIHIVDDDMGEGFKDPFEEHNLEAMRQMKELQDSYLEALRKFKSHGKHK